MALTESRALVVYDMILHRRVNTKQLNTQCVNWPIQGEHNRLQTMLLAGLRFHANAVLQGTRPRQVRLPEKPAHHSASVAVPLFRCSAVPLFRCSAVPLFRCSAVPLTTRAGPCRRLRGGGRCEARRRRLPL